MPKLLNQINSPKDLKKLSLTQLYQLADEIREEIIKTVSEKGGHLAPNLGVVELTIALHLVLDSPQDKIIWDVGHQCYTHKLLTGRHRLFRTLRQYGGLGGFPRREESPHDIFNTGHGSTSISIALGLAKAREFKNTNETIVAVIGDGALTGGLAFEALNQAGHLKSNLIVVLNDNQMAISRSVGATSAYLSKLRLDPYYLRAKANFETLASRLPLGTAFLDTVQKFKDGVKQLLVPGMLFEELGFTYLGPIDGHNIKIITETLKNAKRLKNPVLIHLVTTKGKGYKLAEENASKFHSPTPFNLLTGEPEIKTAAPTYTSVFAQTLIQLARADDRIVAITAAMPEGTGLDQFAQEFPHRFFDVGMAEEHAVTFAAGLATSGLKPVVAIYSTFLQRAYDQILHDVCLQNLPVTFALDRSGIVGPDGPTHQGTFDLSYLRHIPNIILMAPKDENELQHLLKTALEISSPAAIRYPKGSGQDVKLDHQLHTLEIGKSEILKEGKDLFIFAIGSMVYPALKAAQILSTQGISAGVVNARFVKPLDEQLILEAATRVNNIVTVEENVLSGGFGSALLECLERHNATAHLKLRCLGLPDEFITHGDPAVLLEKYGLTPSAIAQKCKELLNQKESI